VAHVNGYPLPSRLIFGYARYMGEKAFIAIDRRLPLRERKKERTRRALADAALRLFTERGFEATTLDDLVDEVEVSKRTFFRYFDSKEDVAMAAEAELWDAYIEAMASSEIHGNVLAALRKELSATLLDMEEGWEERFILTRGVAAHAGSPVLYDYSELSSLRAQRRLVEVLEQKLGIDSRHDVRLRMLGELALSAWRCGARNWVASRGEVVDEVVLSLPGVRGRQRHGGRKTLINRVEEAFDAIPGGLTLSAR
jgi:AcrR family transcriptional regulator